MLKKVILALLIISTTACANKDDGIIVTPEEPIVKGVVNYLALGDSYTIGQGVAVDQRWPNILGERLEALDYNVDSIKIIAQTGWTTANLLQAIDATEINNFNLVSLLIGVNNQYQNQPFTTFETEFNILLDKSIEFAGDSSKVFVVSIPDYGVTPFGSTNSAAIGEELDMYNDYMATQCEAKATPFVNVTEISRTLGDSEESLAPDQLHPSGTQYAEWVNEMLPIVTELLEK